MVDLEAVDDLVDVRAVLDAVVDLKDELGRIAQLHGVAKLFAQVSGRRSQPAPELLFILQSQNGEPDLRIAQIARCFYARHADHPLLHARILHLAQELGDDELNIVVGSCQFIGCHVESSYLSALTC